MFILNYLQLLNEKMTDNNVTHHNWKDIQYCAAIAIAIYYTIQYYNIPPEHIWYFHVDWLKI